MALPPWAVVPPDRRAHIDRVAALLSAWAMPMGVTDIERARWLKAAWLHDARRDAPARRDLEHRPRAAPPGPRPRPPPGGPAPRPPRPPRRPRRRARPLSGAPPAHTPASAARR